MPNYYTRHDITVDEYWIEMKKLYVYEKDETGEGWVFRRLNNGTKGKRIQKRWAPHTLEHYWTLKGARAYEDDVKKYLQDTPNPQ